MRAPSLLLPWFVAIATACSDSDEGQKAPAVESPADAGKDSAKAPGTLAISEVAAYQTVKVPLFSGTKAKGAIAIPLFAKKSILVRGFVTPNATWPSGDIKAELHLEAAGGKALPTISATTPILKASNDQERKTTFNFEIPASSSAVGLKARLEIFDLDGKSILKAPEDGSLADLGIIEPPPTLKIVVVPITYGADGSARKPDTSDAQITLYKQTFLSRYPVSDVSITVRAPVVSNTAVQSGGGGFPTILKSMVQLRAADAVADDVYYYGVFQPNATFSGYCPSGCVLGLSGLPAADDAAARASIGLGYPGNESAETMAHEVGHAHGRAHAPCAQLLGIGGVDDAYPYAKGSIGAWGYDAISNVFFDPAKVADMMGYCNPEWVSDYTYRGLYDRMLAIAKTTSAATGGAAGGTASSGASEFGTPVELPSSQGAPPTAPFHLIGVEGDGALTTDGTILRRAPIGEGIAAAAELVDGTHTEVRARFVPYDHLPGGLLFVPASTRSPLRRVTVRDLVRPGMRTLSFRR